MPSDPQSRPTRPLNSAGQPAPQPPADTASSADRTGPAPAAGTPFLQLAAGVEPVAGYRLVRPLGKGGFGEVWEAVGPGGFPVALKFVRLAEQVAAPEQRALELMKRLRHPNLLCLHGAWLHGDYLILAMELADGTLFDRLRDAVKQGQGGIPPEELLQYLREAAAGIDYLNGQGVQHRDVKPHNLLLVGGAVKVGDFGLAKLLHATVASASGSMTAAYASPEACNDQLSRWSDQYSLAVTYCHLRGNRLPFEGPLAAVVVGHMMGNPDLGMIPEEERAVVAQALAKKPQERWPSCAAFVTALAAGQIPPTATARTAPRVRQAPKAAPPRSAWPVVACGLGLLASVLLLVLIAQFALRDDGKSDPSQNLRAGADSAPDKGRPKDDKKAPTNKELKGADGSKPKGDASKADDPKPKGDGPKVKEPEPKPKADDKKPKAKDEPEPKKPDPKLKPEPKKGDEPPPKAKEPEPKPKREDKKPKDKDEPEPKKPDPPKPPVLAKEIKNTLGMQLVLIPKGTFQMGSPESDKERFTNEHQHEVEITKPFYLGKFEVTKGEFAAFVQATGYKTEAEKGGKGGYGIDTKGNWSQKPEYTWRNPGFEQTDRHPVVNVSWNDAVVFCEWLSAKEGKKYRLPTEAEWEYSCRAGTTTRYHSGDDPKTLATVGNVADASAKRKFPGWTTIKADDGYVFTAPAGQFKANAFGLHDMHGNVWEWCQDWYKEDYYQTSPREDPQGPGAGVYRVIRGGSWNDNPRSCRAAYRYDVTPSNRNYDLGFRVVLVR
ncbi:MAG: bifunctional serine/threonine-protein kinase/formylglycine-generating enzyme family protein [Gemmataceae bacterium]|nr:bifunctional serine/threonine-protein kinase/formylglycine-generating enzyme family protein [Gemmataceae bacterium]